MSGTSFDAARGRRSCLAAGVIGLGLGAWGILHWWPLALTMLKGALPPILLLGGLIAVVAGLTPSDVQDLESPPPPGKPPHAM